MITPLTSIPWTHRNNFGSDVRFADGTIVSIGYNSGTCGYTWHIQRGPLYWNAGDWSDQEDCEKDLLSILNRFFAADSVVQSQIDALFVALRQRGIECQQTQRSLRIVIDGQKIKLDLAWPVVSTETVQE